jgi:hypothetical protein
MYTLAHWVIFELSRNGEWVACMLSEILLYEVDVVHLFMACEFSADTHQ